MSDKTTQPEKTDFSVSVMDDCYIRSGVPPVVAPQKAKARPKTVAAR
jgi:hypothetical protein